MFFELCSLAFASLLLIWFYLTQKRPRDYPPGPIGLPIFGYLPFMGNQPHKKLSQLGTKYGDIFSLHYGSYPIVVLNSLPVIKEAFRQDIFSGRPNHLLAMQVSMDGITFNDGPAGYEQRRFTLKTLRDLGFGKQSMDKLVEEEVKELIEHFSKNLGKPIEIKYIFGVFVINALWAILAGDKFSQDDPRIQQLYRLTIEGFIDPEVAGSLWFLPWFAKMFPNYSGYNKVKEAVHQLEELFHSVVEEHKETYDPSTYRDFIDVYLEKIGNTEDPTSSFYKEVGENNLVHVLIDLFTAGSDTLNSSLNFAILYLLNHPHIMEKVQEEIDAVVGRTKLPCTEDRKRMPYTEAVICEILRFSSIVVGGILHSTTEDCVLRNYFLPKGTILLANLYNVHHEPKVWGDPENFRPERFLVKREGKDGPTATSSHCYPTTGSPFDAYYFVKNENLIPFSYGKRVCLAETMAQTEFFLFLSGLLQHFDFRFAGEDGSSERMRRIPGMEEVAPGLVLSPAPYEIIVTERA